MLLYLLICYAVSLASASSDDPVAVPEGARPFHVSLRLHNVVYDTDEHFCSGAILNPKWVVTAGRCLTDKLTQRIRVFAGTVNRNSRGSWHAVEKTIIHENYNQMNVENDVGLVKVKDEIGFNDKVSAISLPKSATPAGSRCVMAGWGYINQGNISSNLQAVNVTTISTQECRNTELRRFPTILPVSDKQICAFTHDDRPVCSVNVNGGAPLTKDNELVGLESYDVPCPKGFPNVFLKVYDYKDWINNHMK